MSKPDYYKVMWHNCNRCRTHYTSEDPHLKAYLCDDCWGAIPHFTVKAPVIKHNHLKNTKRNNDMSWSTIALYTLGNLCCLAIIGYYLWLK